MNKLFNFLGLVKRSGNLVEGYSKCDEQRNKKDFYLFIIANDASDSSRKKFINHCSVKNIPCIQDFSKEELGHAIGRPEVKIVAVSDENMAKKLFALYGDEKAKI